MNPRYPEVSRRAAHRCEYCCAPEAMFNFQFEVEHVIPVSHAGTDELDNLALSCRSCNINKACHLTGFDDATQIETRLYNPRLDDWDDHFCFDEETASVFGQTEIGRVTVARLAMNSTAQIAARFQWRRLGLFP